MDKQLAVEREKRRAAKEARAWEREKILYDRLLTPNVVRLGLAAGIIAYSTYVTRSKDKKGPVEGALAFALPGIGLPLLAADAGIKDKWALAAISASALAWTAGEMVQGWQGTNVWGELGIGDAWRALTPWPD